MLKGTYRYPAVFERGETVFGSRFDDLPSTISVEDTPESLVESSREALGLTLYSMDKDGVKIPKPSEEDQIALHTGEWIVWVEVDMDEFNTREIREFSSEQEGQVTLRLLTRDDLHAVTEFMESNGIVWFADTPDDKSAVVSNR